MIGSPIAVGQTPDGIAVNSTLHRVYVANQGGDSVSVIDGQTGTVLGTLATSSDPAGVAVDAGTGDLFVTLPEANQLQPLSDPFVSGWNPLTITATSQTMTYGGAVPSFTATYSGFVNGDTSSVVSGLTCGALDSNGQPVSSATPAGTYAITCAGAGASGYNISEVPGTLTVEAAPLLVTANNQRIPVGQAVPVLTWTGSGFVNGDSAATLATPPLCGTTTDGSTAGTYPITCSGGEDADYEIGYQPGTLTVTGTAPLTITASNQSMTYGGAVPAFSVSYSGFVNGDTGSVVSGLICGAVDANGQPLSSSAPAGTYAITCSGANASGYAISYLPGTLTIAPASLVIAAANQSMTYGGTQPAFTWSGSGFANGEGPSSLTTAPVCSSVAAGSAAGTYAITCSGAVDPNYAISYLAGTLTIKQAPLTITAINQSMVYGGAVPAFAASYSGFVHGDTSSVVSGLTCKAVDGTGHAVSSTTPAGSYAIACSGAVAANYAIGYVPGVLTIRLFASGSLVVLSTDSAGCHLLLNGGAMVTAGTVAVNGTSSTALCLNSATLSATTTTVQGGVQNNSGTVHGTLLTHQPVTADRLATLPAPSAPAAACPGAACPNGSNFNGGHTYLLLPGTYSQTINVNGGAVVCVAPGIYVLEAGWNVNSASVEPYGSAGCPALPSGTTDPGVLLYFQQGTLQVNGGGSLSNLQAMQSGAYAGLLYWQVSNATVALNAGVAGGGWYAPKGGLTLNGGAKLTAPYVAVGTVIVNGNATLRVQTS